MCFFFALNLLVSLETCVFCVFVLFCFVLFVYACVLLCFFLIGTHQIAHRLSPGDNVSPTDMVNKISPMWTNAGVTAGAAAAATATVSGTRTPIVGGQAHEKGNSNSNLNVPIATQHTPYHSFLTENHFAGLTGFGVIPNNPTNIMHNYNNMHYNLNHQSMQISVMFPTEFEIKELFEIFVAETHSQV